jgi:hypothetical protein
MTFRLEIFARVRWSNSSTALIVIGAAGALQRSRDSEKAGGVIGRRVVIWRGNLRLA